MDRRTFLFASGAAACAALSSRLRAQTPTADRIARVDAIIRDYDAQGVHRTASAVDRQSADWLREQAVRAGAQAELEPFALQRIDPGRTVLTVGGDTIPGLPFFDATFTGRAGVSGTLGTADSDAPIAVVVLDGPAISSEGQSIAALRRSGRHRAIVALTDGAAPGLTPSNAAAFDHPYGIPVLQVGSEHRARLDAARAGAEQVTLVVEATRTPAQAHNVVASVRGRQPQLPPLIVMTPRSGWWHCAAERGGGIACWLETARVLAAAQLPRTTLLIASSGHELGHYGLDRFLDSRPTLIAEAAAWIHLGANIGAAGGRSRLQASDEDIAAIALRALATAGSGVAQQVPRGTVPGGEARNIHLRGGRYVSLLGSSPVFHSIVDRWPAAVDTAAVAAYAAAIAELASVLAAA